MAGNDNPKEQRQSIEELRYLQQIYQNQYAMIGNSINMVLREMQELSSAQKTLENMDLVEGKEILNGIGGDFYISGKVQDPKKVLVGVGAGYLIEKDIDSAKTYVADLIKKNNDSVNGLTKNKKEVENALVEISYRIDGTR
jgi:prefoldin alpha subunit